MNVVLVHLCLLNDRLEVELAIGAFIESEKFSHLAVLQRSTLLTNELVVGLKQE